MDDISVAAVIPLYNGAPFIREALNSVFAQTVPPAEVIIVDDGSTDDGPQIVEELLSGHANALLMRKANGGQSSARNLLALPPAEARTSHCSIRTTRGIRTIWKFCAFPSTKSVSETLL